MTGLDFQDLERWAWVANYGGNTFGAQYLSTPQRTDGGNWVRWPYGKYDLFLLLDNNEQARKNVAQYGNVNPGPDYSKVLRESPEMEPLRDYLRKHNLWSD